MVLTKEETRDLYRKRAGSYDIAMSLFRLAGYRISHYRRLAVPALALSPGDTVVDLACGTGLNFPLLQEAVGPDGRIIGVDLTDAMLGQARKRVEDAGWKNVELVHSDLGAYEFEPGAAGMVSSLAITLVPEFDDVIRRGAEALRPGGRMVIFDMKLPENWPDWLVNVAVWLNKPYGASLDVADRHPWESVRRYLREVMFREFYFGALYLSVGESAQ
jgi:demethylmenaquinone methyltransferase/2-methoxy-6-polyprenyl-1,4-benzoquinol methylase